MFKNRFNLRNVIAIAIWLAVITMFSGCKKEEEPTQEEVISKMVLSDDNFFYGSLGLCMVDCYTSIYDQNLAGVATGYHDITTVGPMGGTVVITGTTFYDNTHGITGVDLVLNMNNVKYSRKVYYYNVSLLTEVTLTGEITYKGSFSDNYTSVNHQSGNLRIKGSITDGIVKREIDSLGSVSINRTNAQTTANIFGNLVTW